MTYYNSNNSHGDGFAHVESSADGIAWTTLGGKTPRTLSALTKKGARWVGSQFTFGGARICYTDDLSVDWTEVIVDAGGNSQQFCDVTTDGTYFYTGSAAGLYRSADAVTWTLMRDGGGHPITPLMFSRFALLYSGGKYLAVAQNDSVYGTFVMLYAATSLASNSGWSNVTPNVSSQPINGDVVFTGGKFVYTSISSTFSTSPNVVAIYTSIDLTAWTKVVLPVTLEGVRYTFARLLFQGGEWALTAQVSSGLPNITTYLYTSPDLVTWTLVTTKTSGGGGSATKGISQPVASSFCGNGPRVLATVGQYNPGYANYGNCQSGSGATWTQISSGTQVYP